jgi:hypothetical protein
MAAYNKTSANSGTFAKDSHQDTHTHLDHTMDSDAAMHKIRTAGSISITPELFEKLYLSPANVVKGDLRKTFANPTPVLVHPLPRESTYLLTVFRQKAL